MERRDMLLAEIPKRPEIINESKLTSSVDEAAALQAMCETRGWKILYKKFIEPRLSLDRLLRTQGPFRRAEDVGAVRELDLLMRFVNGLIEDGQEANKKLEALRTKKGGNI